MRFAIFPFIMSCYIIVIMGLLCSYLSADLSNSLKQCTYWLGNLRREELVMINANMQRKQLILLQEQPLRLHFPKPWIPVHPHNYSTTTTQWLTTCDRLAATIIRQQQQAATFSGPVEANTTPVASGSTMNVNLSSTYYNNFSLMSQCKIWVHHQLLLISHTLPH